MRVERTNTARLLASLAGCLMLLSMTTPGSAAAAEEMMMMSDEVKIEPIVVGTPAKVEVYPASLKLDGRREFSQLVVTGHYADGKVQDLTRAAKFEVADAKVARVEETRAYPAADGKTQITVSVGGQSVQVPVEVANQAKPDLVSFRYGVQAALTKQSCNSGACHGSPSGKGGFRLSLQAYDPVLDKETLIREAFNRRTNVFEPTKSLLLRKPLMEVAHGGGKKLKAGDPAFHVLHDWIAEGLQVDPPEAPRLVKLDVYPKDRILNRPAHTQQLNIQAHFSDGSVRDVTDIASYSSSDEAVAKVQPDGLVIGVDRGESAILVRYLEFVETSHLMFLKDIEGFKWEQPEVANYVDDHVFAKLEQLKIAPSGLCSDEEFVRRVYLDVIGILPTAEETRSFLAETAPDKRSKLIDQLLQRSEYAAFWTLKWGDLLRVNNKKVSAAGVHKFRRWILASVRDNKPYDEFVAELLTAQGSTFDNPAANYFRTAADTNDCTETTSQMFLGIRIQCAKCHNHPFERWTQDNYYGISSFFNRIQRKKTADADELFVWVARAGEVVQPRTKETMKPWLPLTGEVDMPGEEDRRQALVNWLQRKDNPLFARVAVNRIWGHLLGRGIVEPVDDFRDSNPPANEELLDALAKDFVEQGFDQKHIIRTVLNSHTYQLSSRKNEFNKDDEKYFSHARTRLLSAEQLLDAICDVTGVPEKFAGLPPGTRATQLPSPDVNNQFLKVFGQPAREMACECERSNESNLSQALQMINGPLVHGKLRDGSNRIRTLMKGESTDEEIVRQLYLAALCRQPSQQELEAAIKHVGAQKDRAEGLEDVCWAVLNAKEFLFQH